MMLVCVLVCVSSQVEGAADHSLPSTMPHWLFYRLTHTAWKEAGFLNPAATNFTSRHIFQKSEQQNQSVFVWIKIK